MAISMRLQRVGKKKMPYYRIVVVDSRKPRDGTCVETLGVYQPISKPTVVRVDEERAIDWLKKGAQPSATVRSILSRQGILARFASEKSSSASRAEE